MTQRARSRWAVEAHHPYTRQPLHPGIATVPVWLVANVTPLWQVVLRRKGHDSWWLLTTEGVRSHAAVRG